MILYYTILYYTILYYTILYYTILYYTIPYHTILYYTILCYAILYSTLLYHAVLYSRRLHYVILYFTLLCLGTVSGTELLLRYHIPTVKSVKSEPSSCGCVARNKPADFDSQDRDPFVSFSNPLHVYTIQKKGSMHVYACTCTCTFMYMHMYIYMYMYMCIYIYVFECMHMYKSRNPLKAQASALGPSPPSARRLACRTAPGWTWGSKRAEQRCGPAPPDSP